MRISLEEWVQQYKPLELNSDDSISFHSNFLSGIEFIKKYLSLKTEDIDRYPNGHVFYVLLYNVGVGYVVNRRPIPSHIQYYQVVLPILPHSNATSNAIVRMERIS